MGRHKQWKVQEPPIMAQDPPIEQRSQFWPRGEPMPEFYRRQQVLPCPECKRVRLKDNGRAVKCIKTFADMAYFQCKSCGARFKMQVE